MAKPVKKISFVGGRGPYVYARFTAGKAEYEFEWDKSGVRVRVGQILQGPRDNQTEPKVAQEEWRQGQGHPTSFFGPGGEREDS